MNPATEQVVHDQIPHTDALVRTDDGRYEIVSCNDHIKCVCGATRRRNRLLTRIEATGRYVYLDRESS